jgi:hypothetical protein
MLSNTWDANRRFATSYLPIFRLYKAYLCYQNGKRNNILSLKSWQMRSSEAASSIPKYTMYYKEVI